MQTFHVRSIVPTHGREYILQSEGVTIRNKDFSGVSEGFIEYDEIGWKSSEFATSSVVVLLFGLLGTAFSYLTGGDAKSDAWFVWLCVSSCFFLYYFATRKRGVIYGSDF